MEITVSKIAALAVAIALVILTIASDKSWTSGLKVAVGLLFPLSAIWFGEILGNVNVWGLTRYSPPLVVEILGSLLLCMVAVPVLIATWK